MTRNEKMFIEVCLAPGGLRVVGLVREGLNHEGDPYLEVLASRPGVLSLRNGGDCLAEYEDGRITAGARDVIMLPGVVRTALEGAARNGRIGDASMGDYLGAIRALVDEMAAHRKGGILIVTNSVRPCLPENASYRVTTDCGIGRLLQYLDGAANARRDATPKIPTPAGGSAIQLRRVLREAFVTEARRWVSEFGGLTAMDGATVLDCELGVAGFGVVLPVARDIEVLEALTPTATTLRPYDLWTRGTRHRAAVTYAHSFPGCVVFVASQDGPISCLHSDGRRKEVIVWRLSSEY